MADLPEFYSSDCKFEYSLADGPYDGSRVVCPPEAPLPKQISFEYDVTCQTLDSRLTDTGEKYHVYNPIGTPIEGTNVSYVEFLYLK